MGRRDRAGIDGRIEQLVGQFEGLNAKQFAVGEGWHRDRWADRRWTSRLEGELLLELDCSFPVAAQLDSGEELRLLRVELDQQDILGQRRCRPGRHQGEPAVRMIGKRALVEIGDDFSPFVDQLRCVVATFDLRDREVRRRHIVDCDPRFEICHVEVRVHEIGRTNGVELDDVVGDARLSEIGLFLPVHQVPAQQIHIGVGDILLGEVHRASLRATGGSRYHPV